MKMILFALMFMTQASFLYGEEDIPFSDPTLNQKWKGAIDSASQDAGEGRESCASCGG